MVDLEREQLWQVRVARWRASGMSQQAFATAHELPVHQVGYWVRRLSRPLAALVPVQVAPAAPPAAGPISIRSERGWMLSLPGDVSPVWLAELMRSL